MQPKQVHLISNAHLDPIWQWQWEEGLAAALSTFRTAADFCEQYEGFIFNHNEALLYMWTEEYEPVLFQRIKRLVECGKWRIMGGWFVQPDCNMPSGESFVRHILVGKGYFKDKFGVEPTSAVNFDPFGHSRGLVQILAKSGYDSYLFCRPGGGDLKLPGEQFVWVGFDGSEIMATRTGGYGTVLGTARAKVEGDIAAGAEQSCTVSPWGVGNHGGGPSRKDLADLEALMSERKDVAIRQSSLEDYFADLARVKDSLPRHSNDLNPWAVGCYTSQVRIKQKHRLLENEIYAAEKMAASASAQGLMDYPTQEFKSAFFDLLLSQFHDILPGSSVQASEEDALRLLGHGLETVSRAKTRAFYALSSGQEKAGEGEAPILVYNPHPYRVKAVVDCELMLPDQNWTDSFTATPVFRNGVPLPYQNEKESANINLDWRKRVVFSAELEPSCMNRFDCKYEMQPQPEIGLKPTGNAIVFTTAELEVAINTKTGLLDSYRVLGVEYVTKGAFEPLVIVDNEDPWGMQTHSYREVAGRFSLMSEDAGTAFSGVTAGTIPSVRVVEDGAVHSVVEAVFEYGHSSICQRYILPKQGTEIEVQVRVLWNEKSRMLKLSIPTLWKSARYVGQVAYGVQDLPTNGDESVAQRWTAVVSAEGESALTCINDGTYGSDFSDDGLRLTLLRSPAYTSHPIFDRPMVRQDRFEPRIDQGERLFKFWINGGKAAERLNSIDREALVKNEKPMAVQFSPSGIGTKPQAFAVLDDDCVPMTAAKPAEDGDGYIIRLFEPTGTARSVTLLLPLFGIERKVELSPFEIKTLRVDPNTHIVVETDLLERPV